MDHTYNKFFGLVKEKHKRIRLEIPLVNSWDMNFHMKTKSWGPFKGLQSDVDLFLRDLYLTLEGVWTIDSEGKPEIDPSLIDLGLQHTKITYYDSQYIESMGNWFFKGINIIMRHAMDVFGDEIASNLLNKAVMTHFNNFYKPVSVELFGRKGVFDLNWRMTKDVGMERNVFDFNFLGEFSS